MKRILAVLLLSIGLNCQAQNIEALSFSFFDEDYSIPFTRLSPIHPGAEIGATLWSKEKDKSLRNFNVNLGFYHHEKVENGIYLRGEYAFRLPIKDLFTADFTGTLGYLHTFYPGEIYELNEETGDFEKVTQLGRPHGLASLGIGFTYVRPKRIHPFVRQEIAIESPFANGIPVIIHSFLKVGINFKLAKNEN